MKKHFLSFILIIAFISCEKNKKKQTFPMQIHGYVLDAETNEPIKDIEVALDYIQKCNFGEPPPASSYFDRGKNIVKIKTDSFGYFNLYFNSHEEFEYVPEKTIFGKEKERERCSTRVFLLTDGPPWGVDYHPRKELKQAIYYVGNEQYNIIKLSHYVNTNLIYRYDTAYYKTIESITHKIVGQDDIIHTNQNRIYSQKHVYIHDNYKKLNYKGFNLNCHIKFKNGNDSVFDLFIKPKNRPLGNDGSYSLRGSGNLKGTEPYIIYDSIFVK